MRRIMQKEVHLKPYQELYFTTVQYSGIMPVFSGTRTNDEFMSGQKFAVLVVTGIASPVLMYKYVETIASHVETLAFPDHHHYSEEDVRAILRKFENISPEKKIILTTEKDTMHFKSMDNLPDEFKESLYYITVQVKFLGNEGNFFNKKILNYVGENKSNRQLHKRQNKGQS
jgi:tetraacyldisaccharide 4'-kinase